jgi:EAL domain-containing protein (putative c-di-GMP-specific phosphodiesterase class I)
VLDNVLKSMKQRLQTGELINIAINISAPTLQASDFPELLFNIINKYQVDTSAIIIELTETAYIENFQQVLKNLKQITRKGVRVALDDFGVGFSSFTYLKMLPLSYVKLDGSYIRNLTKNPDDQVFVKSLSAMISAFGMKIIAEFVEDRETLDMIEQLGVTHGQGYFIGKPALFDTIHQNTAVLESV